MPNWCQNKLFVSGSVAQVAKFRAMAHGVEDRVLSFATLVPEPEYPEDKPGGTPAWYTWRVLNWGTKWDASDPEIQIDTSTELMYVFDTAWAPPISWLDVISPLFPKLGFKLIYNEPNTDLAGVFKIRNGRSSHITGRCIA